MLIYLSLRWALQDSEKGGSDGEPSRGRLQPSRRTERAFLGCEEQQRY